MVGPHILQPGCFERQSKVAQSARWGYATTPKIPHRTFLRNGFEDIVCGIHPRELLQIQIWPIVSTVSLVHTTRSRSRILVPSYILVGIVPDLARRYTDSTRPSASIPIDIECARTQFWDMGAIKRNDRCDSRINCIHKMSGQQI